MKNNTLELEKVMKNLIEDIIITLKDRETGNVPANSDGEIGGFRIIGINSSNGEVHTVYEAGSDTEAMTFMDAIREGGVKNVMGVIFFIL